MEPVNILCEDCAAETTRWRRLGFTVLGCDQDSSRDGICQLKLQAPPSTGSGTAASAKKPGKAPAGSRAPASLLAANAHTTGVATAVGTIAWGRKVSPDFKEKVLKVASHLLVDVNFLMACIAFETGERFSPSIKNPVSGAVGLIQFMPTTAKHLGTTSAQLELMSAVDQLDYVEVYFTPWAGRLKTLGDVYMAILWPMAVGKADDYVLFSHGSTAYEQNKGLDSDGDGNVTKLNAYSPVQRKLDMGLQQWAA